MAATALPDVVLLEDANDLVVMLATTGRAVDPAKWADEEDEDETEDMP